MTIWAGLAATALLFLSPTAFVFLVANVAILWALGFFFSGNKKK